ncbi:hypothetical protein NL676_004741 [Syzygium grande]|nr:hypothetical protein NL676_004741 [Syzygium grande]
MIRADVVVVVRFDRPCRSDRSAREIERSVRKSSLPVLLSSQNQNFPEKIALVAVVSSKLEREQAPDNPT